MKIAVTGNAGQVASSLIAATASLRDIDVVAVGRPELNLLDASTIHTALQNAKPDIIVSAAAYTAVDQAEDEPDVAFAVNAEGAGAVASAAAELGVPIIHLSTDYVFDGEATVPYTEDMVPAPRSVYGHSKLAGEHAVALANPDHLILRTAWVFSPYGKNFLKTMLRLAEGRDEIGVVSDQWGNPTSANDIAHAVLHAARAIHGNAFNSWGVFHLAGAGDINWSGFARHILAVSQRCGGPFARINDIATAAYPTKARRPANSRLSSEKFTQAFSWPMPHWQTSTERVVAQLIGAQNGAKAASAAVDSL